MGKPAAYHLMSIGEKQAAATARLREPTVTCPTCDMQVTTVDLLAHLASRCPGPRQPGPSARWLTHREVMAMGVLRGTLSRWVSNGHVRAIGEVQDRRYLHRDLALKIAQQNGFRRR